LRNTRKILISEGFIRARIHGFERSLHDINVQLKIDQSNKKRKKLMKGHYHIKGRLRELQDILECLSESSTMHLVEVN